MKGLLLQTNTEIVDVWTPRLLAIEIFSAFIIAMLCIALATLAAKGRNIMRKFRRTQAKFSAAIGQAHGEIEEIRLLFGHKILNL
ncbi:MAG: hypothetical protein AAF291_00665 [Pseudomonadota bacterium]